MLTKKSEKKEKEDTPETKMTPKELANLLWSYPEEKERNLRSLRNLAIESSDSHRNEEVVGVLTKEVPSDVARVILDFILRFRNEPVAFSEEDSELCGNGDLIRGEFSQLKFVVIQINGKLVSVKLENSSLPCCLLRLLLCSFSRIDFYQPLGLNFSISNNPEDPFESKLFNTVRELQIRKVDAGGKITLFSNYDTELRKRSSGVLQLFDQIYSISFRWSLQDDRRHSVIVTTIHSGEVGFDVISLLFPPEKRGRSLKLRETDGYMTITSV